nr:hypothetical protein [Tanacetum cinerariifolium]
MSTLKFADTHNMVSFLSKPTKSDRFKQIVDFLNAHSIRYALTVNPTIYVSCIEQFWSTAIAKTINGETQKPRKPKRKNTQVPQPSGFTDNVADEAIHKELRDSLVRASTTAFSLEVEHDDGNINKTQSKATPNESSFYETNSGGDPRVKKLEKKNRSRTHKLKRLYKVGLTARVEFSDEKILGEDASKQERRINAIDQDEDITLVNVQDDAEMLDVDDLGGEEVFGVEQEVVSTVATTEELTLAQALEALKSLKPKVKEIDIQEQEEPEVAIDAIPLAVKSPRIVNWKINKEGKKSYYQIIRAGGKTQMYMRRIVEIKSLLDVVGITAAQVYVNTAQLELVLRVNFNEKYTKCLLQLVEVKTASTNVNVAEDINLVILRISSHEKFFIED